MTVQPTTRTGRGQPCRAPAAPAVDRRGRAAFRHVLGRVRARVDRRFDRARYDAVAELAAFGQRMRDELDLAELRDDLAGTTARTLQPTSIAVWVPGA